MPTAPAVLPVWETNYTYEIDPTVSRTKGFTFFGLKEQKRIGTRRRMVANVSRLLKDDHLPRWLWFILGVCNEGQLDFTDTIADESGTRTVNIRLIDGAFEIVTNGADATVTCDVEILRES